jgi:hypothetical protein
MSMRLYRVDQRTCSCRRLGPPPIRKLIQAIVNLHRVIAVVALARHGAELAIARPSLLDHAIVIRHLLVKIVVLLVQALLEQLWMVGDFAMIVLGCRCPSS